MARVCKTWLSAWEWACAEFPYTTPHPRARSTSHGCHTSTGHTIIMNPPGASAFVAPRRVRLATNWFSMAFRPPRSSQTNSPRWTNPPRRCPCDACPARTNLRVARLLRERIQPLFCLRCPVRATASTAASPWTIYLHLLFPPGAVLEVMQTSYVVPFQTQETRLWPQLGRRQQYCSGAT